MSLHFCGIQCPSPLKPLLFLGLAGGGAAAREVFLKSEFKFILCYVFTLLWYTMPLPPNTAIISRPGGGGAAARTVFLKSDIEFILFLYTPVVYNPP